MESGLYPLRTNPISGMKAVIILFVKQKSARIPDGNSYSPRIAPKGFNDVTIKRIVPFEKAKCRRKFFYHYLKKMFSL